MSSGANDALDLREFRRAVGGALGMLGALVLIALLWPKPQVSEEEIIPPQFAKVVMKPAAQTASSSSESAAAPRKAQDTAVAQAFRSQALNNAVSGLLKGGMSKLLSQSNLMVSNPSQTRALFGSKATALNTADARSAANAPSDVKVAAVGGTGAGGGYAKGGAAGVAGQGGGQVSLELADSQVEEGLTKDEVGAVIHKHLSEIRYCYETALMRTSELEGKMLAAFVIGAGGQVRTSSVKNTTLNDARLEDCILRRLNSWKFPKPKGGVDVPVTYPFVFKTLGR
jgi:outer membrane biosynthesis protein TonB